MSETPPTPPQALEAQFHNLPLYSVSEISGAIRRALEDGFALVRVRGEITGFKRHSSGHLYFRLKDEQAVLEAVCWRGTAGKLTVAPEDGLEVIATGRITAYAGRSQYQIVVEHVELAGAGALLKLFEERKRKLEAEGLFAPERKKKIPYLPDVIGVVTSPTGAVIRDILHRLSDRFPRHVLIWPVAVQGEGAAEQVAAAIAGFNRIKKGGAVPRPDVLIVARGGGSLEDLWAFNEEVVVRAAAASEIPLISAIGHETDVTLIDFAADLRAPTPTAAAEMAVPVRADLVGEVLRETRRLVAAMARLIAEHRRHLEGLRRGLPDLEAMVGHAAQRLDDKVERLRQAMINLRARLSARVEKSAARIPHPGVAIESRRVLVAGESRALDSAGKRMIENAMARLSKFASLLEGFSYQRVLERGFALVRDAAGAPVTAAAQTSPGQDLAIRFADGEIGARVMGETATPGRSETAKKPAKTPNQRQGKLL